MSLGFNPNRRVRMTNLPGAVGGSILPMSTMRRRVPSPAAPPPTPRTTTVVVTPAVRRVHIRADDNAEEVRPVDKDIAKQLYEEMQWAYADVAVPLLDADTDAVVEDSGERVLVVYPMQTHPDTGRVRMRMKSVNDVTGQVSMRWVIVYDPETETRYLTRFSCMP